MVTVDFTVSARKMVMPIELFMASLPNVGHYAYGVEKGAGGYMHYQCKAELAMSMKDAFVYFSMLKIHVEESRNDAFDYVYKDGCYYDSQMCGCPDWTPTQETLIGYWLSEGDNDRSVCVVVDTTGCSGKTFLSRSLEDMCLAVRVPMVPHDKISGFLIDQPKYGRYVFDLTKVNGKRETTELMSQIEELKNGQIVDWRYHGRRWKYDIGKPVMVLILCNVEPDHSLLSKDRWKVIYI